MCAVFVVVWWVLAYCLAHICNEPCKSGDALSPSFCLMNTMCLLCIGIGRAWEREFDANEMKIFVLWAWFRNVYCTFERQLCKSTWKATQFLHSTSARSSAYTFVLFFPLAEKRDSVADCHIDALLLSVCSFVVKHAFQLVESLDLLFGLPGQTETEWEW